MIPDQLLLRLLRSVRKRMSNLEHRLATKMHAHRFNFIATMESVDIALEEPVTFHIPLLPSGCGNISIARGASFGLGPAKCIGRYAIRLHTGHPEAEIRIGKSTFINQDTAISAMISVSIGDRCLIGDQVSILDSDFHSVDPSLRHRSAGESVAITIGNNVWIGARAMIMKGVTIGDNTVVAAGAIVTRSLPENVLAGGIPARVIRTI